MSARSARPPSVAGCRVRAVGCLRARRDCALFLERIAWYCLHMSQRLQIQTLRGSTISRIPKLPQPVGSPSLVPVSRPSQHRRGRRGRSPVPSSCVALDLWCWASRTCTRKPRGKRLKWHRFTIFGARRAPSTATAPKSACRRPFSVDGHPKRHLHRPGGQL